MLNFTQQMIDKMSELSIASYELPEPTASYGFVVSGVNLRGIFPFSLLTLKFTSR